MRTVTLLAVVCCLCSGCGVPFDDSPREIDPGRVPFGLLEEDATSSTTISPAARAAAELYLIRSDRLARVTRDIAIPLTPQKLVVALLQGPTDAEAAANLRTAITATSGASATEPEAGLVRVELGRSFATSGAADQVLAIAQLVFTVTGVPGASRVSFTVSGRPVEVPTADGTLSSAPLGRSDFVALAP